MRIDGRKNDELRPVKITVGFNRFAEGSVLMDNSLVKLYKDRKITRTTAVYAAHDTAYVEKLTFF